MEIKNSKAELPEDDWVVYLPNAAMRLFDSAYFNMWQVRQELEKQADVKKQNQENNEVSQN